MVSVQFLSQATRLWQSLEEYTGHRLHALEAAFRFFFLIPVNVLEGGALCGRDCYVVWLWGRV